MAGQGFRDAGYNLVLIQECISKSRSANGTLVVDPVKFPEGMPHLVGARQRRFDLRLWPTCVFLLRVVSIHFPLPLPQVDYIHSKGLKVGLLLILSTPRRCLLPSPSTKRDGSAFSIHLSRLITRLAYFPGWHLH